MTKCRVDDIKIPADLAKNNVEKGAVGLSKPDVNDHYSSTARCYKNVHSWRAQYASISVCFVYSQKTLVVGTRLDNK